MELISIRVYQYSLMGLYEMDILDKQGLGEVRHFVKKYYMKRWAQKHCKNIICYKR